MKSGAKSQGSMRLRARDGVGKIAAVVVSCLLALYVLVLACVTAAAQTTGPDAPQPAPANPPVAAPSKPQGVFDAFGNWVQQGVANMSAGFDAMVGAVGPTGQATKEAVDAARSAATSVAKIPVSGVTSGRERCILAPNGAPDCRVAAEALCRTKGYDGGTSVDFETVEKCPPPYRVSGRNTPEGICTLEHFVTRALCQ